MENKTQLEDLCETFVRLGLKQDPTGEFDVYVDELNHTIVHLGNGTGYAGFYHTFVFNQDGTFIEHGAWE